MVSESLSAVSEDKPLPLLGNSLEKCPFLAECGSDSADSSQGNKSLVQLTTDKEKESFSKSDIDNTPAESAIEFSGGRKKENLGGEVRHVCVPCKGNSLFSTSQRDFHQSPHLTRRKPRSLHCLLTLTVLIPLCAVSMLRKSTKTCTVQR